MSHSYIMLFGLINEANFFVVFIALMVVFFLLGILIGNSINRPKKNQIDGDNRKNFIKKAAENQKETDTQERQEEDVRENQDSEQQPVQRDPRYRYYNWW